MIMVILGYSTRVQDVLFVERVKFHRDTKQYSIKMNNI